MWHASERRKVRTWVWLENLMGRGILEDLDIHGRRIFMWVVRKYDVKSCTGRICIGTGTSDGLL